MSADKRPDRRVQRTRKLLQDTLMSLILEKNYDSITVQDIIDRANVGRSTFYSHFLDKDDLLISDLDHLKGYLNAYLGQSGGIDDIAKVVDSVGVFRHVGEYHPLFSALVGSRGIYLVRDALREHLRDRFRSQLEAHSGGGEAAKFIPATADYLAGSFMTLLVWWLDNGRPHTPEEMATLFDGLVTRGVPAVMLG